MQLTEAEGDRRDKINDYKIAQEKAVKTVLKKVTGSNFTRKVAQLLYVAHFRLHLKWEMQVLIQNPVKSMEIFLLSKKVLWDRSSTAGVFPDDREMSHQEKLFKN